MDFYETAFRRIEPSGVDRYPQRCPLPVSPLDHSGSIPALQFRTNQIKAGEGIVVEQMLGFGKPDILFSCKKEEDVCQMQ